MKLLTTLLSLIVLAATLIFALSNRQFVAVDLWPLDMKVDVPLYLLSLGTLVLGLLLGGVIAWFSFLPQRLAARRLRKELARLQGKIDDFQQTVIPPHTDEGDEAPRLPSRSRWPFRRAG